MKPDSGDRWVGARKRWVCRSESDEVGEAVALEQRAVGEDDELAAVGRDHMPAELEDVGTRHRLPARKEDPLHAERHRLVDSVEDPTGLQALTSGRTRRDEAMRAGEVAEVVDVHPELPEPLKLEVGLPAEIRSRRGAVSRQEPLSQGVSREGLHVEPRAGGVEPRVSRVVPDDLRERCPPVELAEQVQSAIVARDPVGPRGVECHRPAGDTRHRKRRCTQ